LRARWNPGRHRAFQAQEERAMQTGFFELTMLTALMLSSLIWIQPF
jgi:hypothetical protein